MSEDEDTEAGNPVCVVPYDREKQYPSYLYERMEKQIAARDRYTSPYDATVFSSLKDSDVDHLVGLAEAHRSGLCNASEAVKHQFASDPENLYLATPELNRHRKADKDPSEWLPPQKRCWYLNTWMRVKEKYRLVMDVAERGAVHNNLLTWCGNFE